MAAFGSKRTLALQTSFLRVGVNLLGAVALAAYAILTVLSYVQVPVLWRNHGSTPHAVAFFDDLATRFPLIGLSRLYDTNAAIVISYCIPVGIITIAWIALVAILYRREHTLDANLDALLMRWSVAFAVVCVLAFSLLAGAGAYLFFRHLETTNDVAETSARTEFDAVRRKFATLVGRRPLRTRRSRLCGYRDRAYSSASDPGTTYSGSTFAWSGLTTVHRCSARRSRNGPSTSSPAGQTARQYAAL